MRRAAKVDATQTAIVKALRKIGAEVTHLHQLGVGVCDILVSYRQAWYCMELKDGSKPPSAQRLTDDEILWIGHQHAPVHVVNSPEQAVRVLQTASRLVI